MSPGEVSGVEKGTGIIVVDCSLQSGVKESCLFFICKRVSGYSEGLVFVFKWVGWSQWYTAWFSNAKPKGCRQGMDKCFFRMKQNCTHSTSDHEQRGTYVQKIVRTTDKDNVITKPGTLSELFLPSRSRFMSLTRSVPQRATVAFIQCTFSLSQKHTKCTTFRVSFDSETNDSEHCLKYVFKCFALWAIHCNTY